MQKGITIKFYNILPNGVYVVNEEVCVAQIERIKELFGNKCADGTINIGPGDELPNGLFRVQGIREQNDGIIYVGRTEEGFDFCSGPTHIVTPHRDITYKNKYSPEPDYERPFIEHEHVKEALEGTNLRTPNTEIGAMLFHARQAGYLTGTFVTGQNDNPEYWLANETTGREYPMPQGYGTEASRSNQREINIRNGGRFWATQNFFDGRQNSHNERDELRIRGVQGFPINALAL